MGKFILIMLLPFISFRTAEDFREWANWLMYRGGIGVKGEESWEAWWEEELVNLLHLCSDLLD